jgi:limonene-1,2-epoxide hydrolase
MPDQLATVHRVIEAIAAKDYARALPWFTEDCEYTNLPMGSVTGREGIRMVLEPFFGPTISNELIVLRSAVEGDVVFTERLDRHQLKTGWVELPVTGVFEFREGSIAVWREYFDLGTLLRQWPALGSALAGGLT